MATTNKQLSLIHKLHALRNQFGKTEAAEKLKLLHTLALHPPKTKAVIKEYYPLLLFLLAYPDNEAVSNSAFANLQQLEQHIKNDLNIQYYLFNSTVTCTQLCAAYSFEVAKWLREVHGPLVTWDSIEAEDGQINSILSVVMPKVESEILQDGNAHWKNWLLQNNREGEDLLDALIHLFEQSPIRPEVKDELWTALGINLTITLNTPDRLPANLVFPYYHKNMVKKMADVKADSKPAKVKLSNSDAAAIIEVSRMVLIKHFREIDPITFSEPALVNYYKLSRGYTVALFGMRPERRHPIDAYMGYVAFKNGMPVAYAGSWVLFDSARIGLNVFPAYRGGESRYLFEQVMELHRQVYRLKRFSVDPYQIGKDNKDGIHSGVFWLYQHIGFRPVEKEQKQIAEAEAKKIAIQKGYRTPEPILKKLADSRMELVLKGKPVAFDATDLSRAYNNYIQKQFKGNRKAAEQATFGPLALAAGFKNAYEPVLNFVLANWCVPLMHNPAWYTRHPGLKEQLHRLLSLKAHGSEEEFMRTLQGAPEIRALLQEFVLQNG